MIWEGKGMHRCKDTQEEARTAQERMTQNLGERNKLQVIPPSSMVRIEFKIYERDDWRNDRSLLVDSSKSGEWLTRGPPPVLLHQVNRLPCYPNAGSSCKKAALQYPS